MPNQHSGLFPMHISFLQFTVPRMKTAFKLPHTSILRGHLSSPIIVKPRERKTESGKMDSELNFLRQLRSGQGWGSNSTELQTLVSYTMTAYQSPSKATGEYISLVVATPRLRAVDLGVPRLCSARVMHPPRTHLSRRERVTGRSTAA